MLMGVDLHIGHWSLVAGGWLLVAGFYGGREAAVKNGA
jgi:hypothetical protein